MDTVYLTAAEQKVFASLDETIRGGWEARTEDLRYDDTAHRRHMRFELLRISDPALLRVKERAAKASSESEFMDALKSLDLKAVGNKDMTRLLFALGPAAMDVIVLEVLQTAKTKDDLELAVAFALLRHGMLESLTKAFA